MNNPHKYPYLELLMRSITAFQAAMLGPDPYAAERDAPVLDRYLVVLQRQKLNLHGWVNGHPKLGTRWIQTSVLIHVTQDQKWARTLSGWYRLGDPGRLDTSRLSPEIDLAGICVPMGDDRVRIPLQLGRRIMEQRPTRFAELAKDKGYGDVSQKLVEIAERWPPPS